MAFNSKVIQEKYSSKLANSYDKPISHLTNYKRQAFADSSLKHGDKVLVFCCGTGLDFSEIIKKIGEDGKIIAIDFSSEMLAKAEVRIKTNNWNNIELIQADVTEFKNDLGFLFDAGVCTLGMSIIPDYLSAYSNLCSNVRENGEIIIGDAQLATNGYSWFNPIMVFMAKRFGGSYEGYKNSLDLKILMKKELKDVIMKEFFLNTYYYCIGKK